MEGILKTSLTVPFFNDWSPSWSPDGKRIALRVLIGMGTLKTVYPLMKST